MTDPIDTSISPPKRLVSIMLVALNEAHHMEAIRIALDQLKLPEGVMVERILVDGGSTDGTLEAAYENGFTQCFRLPGKSIPVCRNHALQNAHGEWLAFLDADCLPCSSWLLNAAPWLESPEPTMLGYPVIPPGGGNWIQNAWWAHWKYKNLSDNGSVEPVTEDAFRLITTRNMLFNRVLLQTVPHFDEALVTGEDTDFAFRATQSGCRVIALPTLRVTHLGEPNTLSQFYRQQLWHANRRAYATILKKTGGRSGANAIFFSFAFAVAFATAALGLLLALIASPWSLLLLLPLLLVICLPAALIATRAKMPILFPRLCILYTLYGFARSVDLIGLAPRKPTWKSTAPPPEEA